MRFDTLKARLQSEVFAVEPNFANMVSESLNGEAQAHTDIAHNSVTYQVIGSTAVIAVDGAMHKKDMSGLCMSVASYDKIIKLIDDAEADDKVSKIVFRVDTPGGAVAGADEVRNRILASKKETITFYDNMGASAGIWVFTASDKIYATETTILGSIGVILTYQEPKEKTWAIVSSAAPNKFCDIADEGCKNKIQSRLNEYEAIFFDRLTSRFDKPKEKIAEDFNNGATIFAKEAHKLGYIDGVMEFRDLLEKPLPVMTKESNTNTQGETMTVEELRSEYPDQVAAIEQAAQEGLQGQIDALEAQIGAQAALEKNVISMAKEMGASLDAVEEALQVDDEVKAENILLKALQSGGAVSTGEAKLSDNEPNYEAIAEKYKGAI